MVEHNTIERLAKAAARIFDGIGHDILALDPDIDSEGIVEVCFDAGRLQQHDPDLYNQWKELVGNHGYVTALKMVAEKSYL